MRLRAFPAALLILVLILSGCMPAYQEGPILVEVVNLADLAPMPTPAAGARVVSSAGIDTPTNATWYNGADLAVYSDNHSTSVLTVDGATGNTAVGGTLAVTGGAALSSYLDLSSTTVTPTVAGLNITPTYSLYRIGSSVATSITLAVCTRPGQIVYFYGEDANNVAFQDSNVRTSTGSAITIGQYDLIGWLCEGTEWIEMFVLANS